MTTRRSILQGLAGAVVAVAAAAVFGVMAKAWCPGAARPIEPVRRWNLSGTELAGDTVIDFAECIRRKYDESFSLKVDHG